MLGFHLVLQPFVVWLRTGACSVCAERAGGALVESVGNVPVPFARNRPWMRRHIPSRKSIFKIQTATIAACPIFRGGAVLLEGG